MDDDPLVDVFGVEDSDSDSRTKSRHIHQEELSDSDESIPVIVRSKNIPNKKLLREEYDYDPELYGIRRSHRPRKETEVFNIKHDRPLKRHHTSSCSSDDSDVVYSKSQYVNPRSTRGNKVDYKQHFSDKYSDFSDEEEFSRREKNKVQAIDYQRRDGPLIRKNSPSKFLSAETEVDKVEDVLAMRYGRKGATGNDTTVYSDNDPNNGFNVDDESKEVQYLIKWKGWSHIHNTWESEDSLDERGILQICYKKIDAFKIRMDEIERSKKYASRDELESILFEEEKQEEIRGDYQKIERIISHTRSKNETCNDYFIKWCRLEYSEATWEDGRIVHRFYKESVDEYNRRCTSNYIPRISVDPLRKRPKFIQITSQPKFIGGKNQLKLREYQLDSLNWMVRAWTRGNSVILADEMGLGKTIQTIAFLSYLFYEYGIFGPFILVVPLSTVSNWYSEFQTWAPELNAIVYLGNAISRQIIREYEWFVPNKKTCKLHVCITTYEIARKEKTFLAGIKWAFLGVDEAHALKNDESELYKALFNLDTNTRMLITGTPMQNVLRELWALLHFIMPHKFTSFQDFQIETGVSENNLIGVPDKLHPLLQPFLLRREKKDVEKSLPPKLESILRFQMSNEQRRIYKDILGRNYDDLIRGNKGRKQSFINIIMQLKKCCNHVRLVFTPESEYDFDRKRAEERLYILLKGSAKLMALDKLLVRFKENGHRVLIFSQMVIMLDIIAVYMSLRGWTFQRLDGSIRGELRKQAIEHFNAENSTDFCFLLSTRAGGLGVNLATADTVIIFDSDWNPHNDIQAQARAHRIGQTKQVSVYRFVVKNSIEENIIERSKKKMVLEHVVIKGFDSSGKSGGQSCSKEQLNEIIRFGAEDLFKEDDTIKNDDIDIDEVLKGAESRDLETDDRNNNNSLLNQFKVVHLDIREDEECVYMNSKSNKTWAEIIPEKFRNEIKSQLEHEELIKTELIGPRVRNQRMTLNSRAEHSTNEPSLSSSGDEAPEFSVTLSDKELRALIRSVKKFPKPLLRVPDIVTDLEFPEGSESKVTDAIKHLINGCQDEIDKCQNPSNKPTFMFGRIPVLAKPLIQSIKDLEVLHDVMSADRSVRLAFQLDFQPKIAHWDCVWEADDDSKLLIGVYEKGLDNWDEIKMEADYGLTEKILPIVGNLRPQATHLRTRVEYLLKEISRKFSGVQIKEEMISKKPKSRSSKPSNAVPAPKSAEFIDESSNSSDNTSANKQVNRNGHGKSNNNSVSSQKTPKLSNKIQSDKPSKKRKSIQNSEVIPIEPLPLTDDQMKQCTSYLRSEKQNLKTIEKIQEHDLDNPSVRNALYCIGKRIKSVLKEMPSDKDIWREIFWQFVTMFTQVDVRKLHHTYKEQEKNNKKRDNSKRHHSNI